MQSNIEMFKRLQERITALEMRVEAIEGEKFRCIDTDEELKVTSAEGKFTISHIFNENHYTFCTD